MRKILKLIATSSIIINMNVVATPSPIELGSHVPLDFLNDHHIVLMENGHIFSDTHNVADLVGYKLIEGVLISKLFVKTNNKFTLEEISDILHAHSENWGVTNSLNLSGIYISQNGYFARISEDRNIINISKITFRNDFSENTES